MSDRIAVMNKGRYEQLGDPETLYERPDDPLRRRLPRREQPAPGARRRDRRRLRGRSGSADGAAVRVPPRSSTAGPRSTSASGRRRSGSTRPGRADAGRSSTALGASSATPRTSASARSTTSRPGAGRRVTVYEQNIERATKAELWAPRRRGRPRRGPRTTRSSSGRDRRAGRRIAGRDVIAGNMEEDSLVDRDRQLTRHRSAGASVLAGGALAGVAAFLAACGTKGTADDRARVRRPAAAAPSAAGGAGASEVASAPAPPRPRSRPRRPSSTGRTGRTTSTSTQRPTKHPTIDAFTAKYGTKVQLPGDHRGQRGLLRHDQAGRSRPARTPAGTSSP